MKFFVLAWRGQGWEDAPAHYLYKSVSKRRHKDFYDWKITTDLSEARRWATREGAEGYAPRFAGAFVVAEVTGEWKEVA